MEYHKIGILSASEKSFGPKLLLNSPLYLCLSNFWLLDKEHLYLLYAINNEWFVHLSCSVFVTHFTSEDTILKQWVSSWNVLRIRESIISRPLGGMPLNILLFHECSQLKGLLRLSSFLLDWSLATNIRGRRSHANSSPLLWRNLCGPKREGYCFTGVKFAQVPRDSCQVPNLFK